MNWALKPHLIRKLSQPGLPRIIFIQTGLAPRVKPFNQQE